jgi:hypothetical protein
MADRHVAGPGRLPCAPTLDWSTVFFTRGARGTEKPLVFSFPVAVLLGFRSFAPVFLRFRIGYCRRTKIRGTSNPYFNIR